MHAYRGDKVCRNHLLIARGSLEAQLLAGLQAKVLHPDVIAYAFSRFENLLVQAINQQSSETTTSRRRLEQIEREIRNCTQAIASMGLSPFLRAQLQELEAEHGDLKEKLASLAISLAKLEPLTLIIDCGCERYAKIRGGQAREPGIDADGRAADRAGGDRKARAENHANTGRPDLNPFGDVGFARRCGCYNGAGGQNRTGYARLFRAALYQ